MTTHNYDDILDALERYRQVRRRNSPEHARLLRECELSVDERRHRDALAARTLTPVPGMGDFMHDVIREARRFEYRRTAFAATEACPPNSKRGADALKAADAMIEREDSE